MEEVIAHSGHAMAELILDTASDMVLVVRPGRDGTSGWQTRESKQDTSTAYLLHEDRTGVWDWREATWHPVVDQVLSHIEARVRREYGLKRLPPAVKALHGMRRNASLVRDTRLHMDTVRLRPENESKWPRLSVCSATDLDADVRYLGTPSGVVDLDTAKLLPPDEGARKLVTKTTRVPYVPAASHPDVWKLLEHLPGDMRLYWIDALAFALRGRPSARFYLAIGDPGGGKSTMFKALRYALGEYASEPADSTLAFGRIEAGSHTEGMEKLASPYRIAIFDEIDVGMVSAKRLKRVVGGGSLTFRRLHRATETRAATVTPIISCNTGREPRFDAADPGIQRRLRELHYPTVPAESRDLGLIDRVESPQVGTALLALLVERAAQLRRPPNTPESVRIATRARIAEDVGDFGRFAYRLTPREGHRISVSGLWDAWRKVSEGDDKESGGIKRSMFVRRLRRMVPRLPSPQSVWIGDQTLRGWDGWSLDPEEVTK